MGSRHVHAGVAIDLAAVLGQVTMLGFGLNQFPSGYAKSGDLQNAIDALTWGADYLVAAHSSPNHFVAVVGNSTLDFAYYVSMPCNACTPAQTLRQLLTEQGLRHHVLVCEWHN